jgi:hypothetical protein
MAFEASVVWRRANGDLGLKIKAAHDLDRSHSKEMKSLRRYCVDVGG